MPRGVAIPELHERLFQAAERLLLREGPAALSSRAITTEAGCAKGLLHNHFTDLDGFLVRFVLTRFHSALDTIAELPSRAGQLTIHDNLAAAAAALFRSPVLAAHAVITYRPAVAIRLRATREHHSPSLTDLEYLFTAYLDAEKDQGRIQPHVDTPALAVALVATIHHLLMAARGADTRPQESFDRVLAAMLPVASVSAAQAGAEAGAQAGAQPETQPGAKGSSTLRRRRAIS